jgi:type I restriction enzyme, S subunit
MCRWIKGNIGDVLTLQRGVDITKAEQRPGRIPVVSSGGISSHHDTSVAKGPGVVIGRKGTLGTTFWLECEYWPHDTTLWVKDFRGNDPKFVYYFLRWHEDVFLGLDNGTANPTLNRNHVHLLPAEWPEVPEQRAIAEVLGALDDKIELNRQMNHTLEEMASALFKSWFVDFDPVVAKSEGRKPFGMDAATAGLFPAEFQADPSWGDVPKGWTTTSLDEIAEYRNGLALQNFRPDLTEPRLPVIKIAQMRTGRPDGSEWAKANIDPGCILDDGDIVFSWSGSLAVVVWCGGRGALNQHLFKVTSTKFPKWFFHQWTLFHLPEFQAIAADKATTMGHIRRFHLTDARVVTAPPPLIAAADRQMAPWLDLYIQNELESRTLSTLRDLLLPKLLSGEIRLKDAEKQVEAAL